MPERMIDVVNPAAGIRSSPAFQPSEGGASRMLNYLISPTGEFEPRAGYSLVNTTVYHISSDGSLTHPDNNPQTGPLVIADNSEGDRLFFRLPLGATYVLAKDRLFVAIPPQSDTLFDPSGYWIDLLKTPITDDSIFRWSNNTDLGGDRVRPSAGGYFRAEPVSYPGAHIAPREISHPVLLGLLATPPNAQNPMEIVIRTGGDTIEKFKLSIRLDEKLQSDDTFFRGPESTLLPNQTYVFQWAGSDAGYHKAEEYIAEFFEDYWTWVVGLAVGGPLGLAYGALIDRLFIPDPPIQPEGHDKREITQEEYENCYLQVEYEVSDVPKKFRYYLYGHKGSDVGSQVATALQAGFSVGQLGASVAGPYGVAAGAAVAVAGTAGALISRAFEGERVDLSSRFDSDLTPSELEGAGFQIGQYVFCRTYSDENNLVESLPSRTSEMMMFDFFNIKSATAGRTRQKISFTVYRESPVKTPSFDWATHINIYAARTSNPDAHNKLPQETGLDFRLVQRVRISDIDPELGRAVEWEDELFYSEDGSRDGASQLLRAFDNDAPPRSLNNITAYGSRIWGVNREDNSVRYSKLGPYGYHHFPSENSLIPQILTFDNDHSPIVALHPASSDSMLYVFKQDVIHILRGHGEIRGLYNPRTPVDVDIDASIKIDNTGTSSPGSICSLKNSVMFVGSDGILYNLSGIRVTPFSLAIQPYLERLDDSELAEIFGFEYRNMYLLCLPNETLVLDLQKRYWTIFDWRLKGAFWARQGRDEDSTLYGLDRQDRILELFSGTTDAGKNFVCEWESNPSKMMFEGHISGIYVFHDESKRGPLEVGLSINNRPYQMRTFIPAEYNRFRQGFSDSGHRVQVKVVDRNREKLRIDRVQLGAEL